MPSEKQSRIPKHPNLWLAKDLTFQRSSGISTGYENLDSVLPDTGWPKSGLVEIEYQSIGVGELRLLAPVLKQLSHSRNQWITWIDSPCIPYAPGLHSLGIDIRKMLLIQLESMKPVSSGEHRAACQPTYLLLSPYLHLTLPIVQYHIVRIGTFSRF